MRNTFIIILIIFNNTAFCQIDFYYPDGTKYIGKAFNIGGMQLEVEEKGRVINFCPGDKIERGYYTNIGFKFLTNIPLFIIPDNPDSIEYYISLFDLEEYLNSISFEFDIEKFIEEKVLDENYLINTLGEPDCQLHKFCKNNNLIYKSFYYKSINLTFNLRNSIVYKYSIGNNLNL